MLLTPCAFVLVKKVSKSIRYSANRNEYKCSHCLTRLKHGKKGVGMIRAEIGLKNRQIINETYSFRCFLIL
jgi:hypothetical protein